MKTLILNPGLPRAGTTLIQNILAQNPLIHPENTSGLSACIVGSYKGYCSSQNISRNINKEKHDNCLIEYCRAGIQGYLNTQTTKPIIIDKNRNWTFQYPFIKKVIPDLKIIYLVRDLRSIFSSLEKQ